MLAGPAILTAGLGRDYGTARAVDEIDLDEIWSELKRAVPRTIIEVSGPKETVKIWFE